MDDGIVFRNKLILVMGMQRSGTTALLYALGQDPQLQVENEQPGGPIWEKYRLRPERKIRRLLWSFKRRLVLKPVLEIEHRTIDSVLEEFVEYDPLVAWIYRDPVNVWSSAKIEFDLTKETEKEWIAKWIDGNESALRSVSGRNGERIAVVRYEDLIAHRNVFDALCRFLRIEPRNNLFWREDKKKGRKSLPPAVQKWIEEQTSSTMARLDSARIRPEPVESVSSLEAANAPLTGFWSMYLNEGCQARLLRVSSPAAVRVEIDHTDRIHPHGVQLAWGQLELRQGRKYTCCVWARADRLRKATVQVTQNHEPWHGYGLCEEIELGPGWRPIAGDFVAERDDSDARLLIDLGLDDAAVEVTGLAFGSPLFCLHELNVHDGSEAVVVPVADEIDAARIEFRSLDRWRPDAIQFVSGRFEIRLGAWYSVSLRSRADRPRLVSLVVGEDNDPWEVAGIYQKLSLTPEWQTFFHTFRATKDGAARLYFDVGEDDASVEITDIVVGVTEAHLNDLFERNGARCGVEVFADRPGVLRFTVTPGSTGAADDVQVFVANRSIRKGMRYYATFVGRADQPRNVGFGVVRGQTAWEGVGLYYTVGVGTRWKPYYYEFVAESDADFVRVLFDLGDSAIPIEVKDIRFAEAIQDITARDVDRLRFIVDGLRTRT